MKYVYSLLACLILITPAYSSSEEIMLGMIDYITANSKYIYNGEQLPYIEIKTLDEICRGVYTAETYENEKDDCGVVGYYNHNINSIAIADESGPYMIDERFFEVVLFHELVHFLQYINGEDKQVSCRNELEKDAYLLQNMYIEHMNWPKEQKVDLLFAILAFSCANYFGSFGP